MILNRREALARLGRWAGGGTIAGLLSPFFSRGDGTAPRLGEYVSGGADASARKNSAIRTSATNKIRQSVCRWPYAQIPLDELCRQAVSLGIEGVELVGPSEWAVLKKHGLTCPMANGAEPGIDVGFIDPSLHAELRRRYESVIPQVAEAGFPQLICFTGNANGIDPETGMKNFEKGIKPLLSLAEKSNIILCLELFNTKVDHPGYMADNTAWGIELCDRLGSDHFKLLYDIYHMQIMEGDIIRTIRQYHDYFSHYHTGGVPGRNEIDSTQELNYPAIMRAIADTGYQGFVGQEFIPTRENPFYSLREAVQLCDV